MQQSESSEWKKRRTVKKEKVYECGCGKKYKVYASLETHIKMQHAGTSPGPVKLPEKNTRGRPKQNPMHELAVGAGDVSNPLELLPGLREGWTGIRSTGLREVYEREPVYQLIVRFQDGGKELNFVEEDRIYEVSMGKGLLLLLDQLKAAVREEEFVDELIMLITTYVSYVIEETEDQNVLSNGSIGLLPEFANYFLLYDLERRCERLRIKNLWINHLSHVVEVFSIIFRWLVFKKFTLTRATVNQQFLADKLHPEEPKADAS